MLAALAYPLQLAILSAIVMFSLASRLAEAAGIFGIFLYLLITFAFIQFSFMVFRASAMDDRNAPVVGPDDFNPWHSPAPLFAAVIGLIALAVYSLVMTEWGQSAALAVVAIVLFALPASLALLAVNGKFFQAISPWHIGTAIFSMGAPYLLMPLIMLGAFFLVGLMQEMSLPWIARSLVDGYIYFLAIHLMGKILYQYRDRIGFEPVNTKILQEEYDRKYEKRRSAEAMEEAYHMAGTDSRRALAIVLQHLERVGADLNERRDVFRRLSEWPNATTSLWYAQDLIAREIAAGNHAEALAVTIRGVKTEPKFRPRAVNDTLRLAKLALETGQYRIVTTLLSDFADRYPDNASVLPSMLMCAKIALEHTNETALAKNLIERAEATGKLANDPRLKVLRGLLDEY